VVGEGNRATARVLLVEDEEMIRETLGEMLALYRHRVTLATSGPDALRQFRAGAFDIVMTDLGMPGMSGLDLAREIRRRDARVGIVLATGWGTELGREEVAAAGVDICLCKPLNLASVQATMTGLLGGQAGSGGNRRGNG
jgi:DNA-binding response OmpR family regulator